jgi:pimeloyl-ACP methyl ester carboxylesterase
LFTFTASIFLSCSNTSKIKTAGKTSIAVIERIPLGGSTQFVLIRGHDICNPLLLFLHGGPGAAETAMFRKYNGELEKHFTVVYWDQRGAGKSYSRKLDLNTVTLQQYLIDTHQLVSHLKARFRQEKIFLVGHSWGTKLGMYAIQEHPEDFHAFVGVGQEVASFEGEAMSYEYTLKKATETNDLKALADLEEMGAPQNANYNTMYKNGFWGLVKQKHLLLKSGGERYAKTNYVDWISDIWFSKEYTFLDLFKWSKGSASVAGQMLKDPAFESFNFFEEIPTVKIPVIFISGNHDFNTPWPLVEEYYNVLKAPSKEFILIDKAGHSPCFEQPDFFNQILQEKLLSLNTAP